MPVLGTSGASGRDLHALLSEPVTIEPLGRVLIPTGISLEIPQGYEAQIRPRSGLALKHGVTVLNSPGTIDSDYRGEVGVILVNLSSSPFTVNNGDRIAQMVFCRVVHPCIEESSLSVTSRGSGGFGSTGISPSPSSPVAN